MYVAEHLLQISRKKMRLEMSRSSSRLRIRQHHRNEGLASERRLSDFTEGKDQGFEAAA